MSTKTVPSRGLLSFLGRGREKPHTQEDTTQHQAKLVASIRKAGRVSDRGDLPLFRSVLSPTLDVTGNDLSLIAVVDLGNREALLLVSDSALGARLHLELRKKVLTAGYKLEGERLAATALIASVNKAINGDISDSKASDVREIVEELIRDAINDQATDIHLCRREASGMALFRIHSRMYRYQGYEPDTCNQMAGYLYTNMSEEKTRSNNTFSLENKSMSCMVRKTVEGKNYKLRYKYIRMFDGWDVIIRILLDEKPGVVARTYEDLGYEVSQSKQLGQSVARSYGFIAFTGPTGSGKSTALKASMESDPNRKVRKRYSVEDPVEYKIFGVSQISVQRDDHEGEEDSSKALIGTLRDILRGDPDDVMVGETRDRATASILADFVVAGNKLYTTLHTSSAFGAILRLNRLGLDRHILADRKFISAIAFQRLLPVLCDHCKVPASEVLPEIKLMLLKEKFKLDPATIYCSTEGDCIHCQGRGITGSTVVAEIVTPDKEIRSLIAEGRDEQAEDYWRQSRRTGFDDADMTGKTAYEHALYKISQGRIDPQDLEREFEPLESYELVEVIR
ncbi:GspE/PulE family protein [Pseudomonas sp. F1002]|uniref:GspE/PulE family protein n=1 Tax=Pseudomonas sp. F1002 TaxID=2738821 RepID=UPI0015A3A6FD|nr:ATPase, T2SS/T4P/T4SS family [Pseudomonas sp. F1002]NWB63510.1 Flp pilus assembly complex ATPase component TadA [Pseudomonas sp. F1002]